MQAFRLEETKTDRSTLRTERGREGQREGWEKRGCEWSYERDGTL